ncbi:MAG: hypothetical protein G01um1014106_12 [Parcubacteria group bacterium Gr01-1014_106]|nr:MAG: hypothetical protein G01um1014106_12 [Parcubacteria group bacterium Gr01-1014_106]
MPLTTTASTFIEEDPVELPARETVELSEDPTAFTDTEQDVRERVEAGEPFQRWFGDADLTMITFHGELGPSHTPGHEQELYVDGEPVSAALSTEDRAYYTEIFLHELHVTGRAAWRGAETSSGVVVHGTEAVRTSEGITLTFAERVDAHAHTEEHIDIAARGQNEPTEVSLPTTESGEASPVPIALDAFIAGRDRA